MKKYRFFVLGLSICLIGATLTTKQANLYIKKQVKALEQTFSPKRQSILMPFDYINWVEDHENGFIQSKTIKDYTFTAFFKPLPYLVLKELEKSRSITPKNYQNLLKEYGNFRYFTFRISKLNNDQEFLKEGLVSQAEYYSKLEYYSFQMQEQITLIEDSKVLPCVLFHFERSFDASPYLTFVIGFNMGDKKSLKVQDDIVLVYEDKMLGVGKINLTIPTSHNLITPNI